MGSVLDYWDPQCVMVTQISGLLITFTKAFYLLNIVDFEDGGVRRYAFEEESDQNSPLRVRMDATSGISFCEGCNKEWGTLRGLEGWGRSQVDSLLGIKLFGKFEDVDIFGFHEFFLYAGGGEVD